MKALQFLTSSNFENEYILEVDKFEFVKLELHKVKLKDY